jgi:hypothetical protein
MGHLCSPGTEIHVEIRSIVQERSVPGLQDCKTIRSSGRRIGSSKRCCD